MKIYRDIIQGSEEWFKVRELKLSASHGQSISANGKGLVTYCKSKVKELIVGKKNYTNKDMQRGNDLEPAARIKYEFERGVDVVEVGAVEYNDFIICSPDGLIFDGDRILGGIEIKAKNDDNHYEMLLGGKFESKEYWQCQMNMLITGAEWWDLISYNPNYYKSIIIERVLPDSEKFGKLLIGFKKGEQLIKENLGNKNIKEELKKII